jgi:hypothetical protein
MSTEFKSFDEMNPYELALERKQHWTIEKSTTAWWIKRNHVAFMPVHTLQRGIDILKQYGITDFSLDTTQREVTAQDFAEFRRDKMRLMGGKGPSVLRRVYRFFGGDAA